MDEKRKHGSSGCECAAPPEPDERRPYVTPEIEVLGDVRDLTLGATPGAGDSTPQNTQPF